MTHPIRRQESIDRSEVKLASYRDRQMRVVGITFFDDAALMRGTNWTMDAGIARIQADICRIEEQLGLPPSKMP